jgi:2-methylcitrate dehydratase
MVKEHHVRVYKSEENLPREDQLAHKIAMVAADPVEVPAEVTEMVINRIIDNASVAIASLNRAPDRGGPGPGLTHAPVTRRQGREGVRHRRTGLPRMGRLGQRRGGP